MSKLQEVAQYVTHSSFLDQPKDIVEVLAQL